MGLCQVDAESQRLQWRVRLCVVPDAGCDLVQQLRDGAEAVPAVVVTEDLHRGVLSVWGGPGSGLLHEAVFEPVSARP